MCFSASASFTAAAILSIISLLSIRLAQTRFKRMLALTPLFFAIQQFFEGIIWLSWPAYPLAWKIGMYAFLFFALVFWPLWISYLMYLYEQKKIRKRILRVCVGIANALAVYSFFYLLLSEHISAVIVSNHIAYIIPFPSNMYLFTFFVLAYLASTVLPLLISSKKYVWIFGVTVFIAYIFTYIGYQNFVTSVWCFFGAILSGIIGYIVYHTEKRSRAPKNASN